jgi:hypothetical protein
MNAELIEEMGRQNPQAVQQAQEQLRGLLARSATDMEFRRKLLSDPRAAVSEYTGYAVPESTRIVFVENRADATFVLPDAIDSAAELSEADLEAVAGGATPMIAALLTAFCMGLTSND